MISLCGQLNLASDEIPFEIEAFLSLGPKACPVELDVNIARLDGDIHAFIRRLRLVQMFKDEEDKRQNPDFIPKSGKSAPLDMFAYKLLQTWNGWKQRRRTPDNLTKIERKGKDMLKHIMKTQVYTVHIKHALSFCN